MDRMIGRRMIPQFSTPELCYLSQNNLVLEYNYDRGSYRRICSVGGLSGGVKGFIKEKVLRNHFYRSFVSKAFGLNHVVVSPGSHLIAIYDGLYTYDLADKSAVASRVLQYDKFEFVSPLKSGIALHEPTGDFYFGEYINGVKTAVRICRISRRGEDIDVDVVFEFEAGRIQHVHGIYYDQFRRRLWVTTGDRDHECAIFYTDDCFETINELGGGDQTWRAVSIAPTQDKIYWGMDAGKDAPASAINKIFSYDLASGVRKEEAVIGNPAYHSVSSQGGDIFLGINFEPGRKQDTAEKSAIWRYKALGASTGWRQIREFPYLPGSVVGCSRYGYVYFPSGVLPDDKFIYAALNVSNRKFATYLSSSRC